VLEKGQYPFAAIVCCADSRVPPEIVFDQGLGDLFVLRTAGNIVDDLGVACLEYAAAHLGVPLIVVMGHSRCGAVTAAVEGGKAPGRLSVILAALAPAVEKAKNRSGDVVDAAARENVKSLVATLEGGEGVLKDLVDRGALRVVGAFYDIEHGSVEFIG
jgi:carbonic anhydrase